MKNFPVYLDNAATTFPKPQRVISEVEKCLTTYCGNPSRGNSPLAQKSSEAVFCCRAALGEMFGCSPENVIFTYNTTYALNMAIKGVLSEGDHVLISDMEHNSVLRPVEKLRRDGVIGYDVFMTYGKGVWEILEDIDKKILPNTRALCCIHASNICSHSLPIEDIGRLCRDRGILFICDGAQSAGHIPIDMRSCGIDILCLPAHKGLYGTQGGGIMLLGDGVSTRTLLEGGNGVHSLELEMGGMSPEKYEAGTLCVPAIVGLYEGLKFVNSRGLDAIRRQEELLFSHAKKCLESIPRVRIYDSTPGSVLLFGIDGICPDEAGEIYGKYGVCLRTGFHCSPLAHGSLGTGEAGGIRMSFGAFNTPAQISYVAGITEDISRGKCCL